MASIRTSSSRNTESAHAAQWPLIEQIYRDHVTGVWQFVFGRLRGDRDGADDVTSTIFLTVTEEIGHFDPARATVAAWVYSIARNKTADYLRRRYRERKHNKIMADSLRDAEWVLFDASLGEDRAVVVRILSGMPAPERDALIWKYCERLSTRDIAMRLRRTEKACENLLARARERFRIAMKKEEKSEVRHAG